MAWFAGWGVFASRRRLQHLELLAEAFRLRGYTVLKMKKSDPHIDLVVGWQGQPYLVQSRPAKPQTVTAAIVQALHEIVRARSAAGGFVVTFAGFTADALELAERCNIHLVDSGHFFAAKRPSDDGWGEIPGTTARSLLGESA